VARERSCDRSHRVRRYDGGREVGVRAREGRSRGATASPRPNRASQRLKRDRSAGSCSAARGSTRTSGVAAVGWADSFGTGVCDMSRALQEVARCTGTGGDDFKDGAVKSLASSPSVDRPGVLAQVAIIQ
jgi:hypothetical protein